MQFQKFTEATTNRPTFQLH